MLSIIKFRGWTITERSSPYTQWDKWEFIHENYDGPESNLCGLGHSYADCLNQIKEIEAND